MLRHGRRADLEAAGDLARRTSCPRASISTIRRRVGSARAEKLSMDLMLKSKLN